MNKPCSHKRTALLAFALLLGLPCVLCFLWVRKEQRQYALNRQLIAALKQNDAKQAIALVNTGADPNTRVELLPMLSWSELLNQSLHHSQSPNNDSPTALMIACGASWREQIPIKNRPHFYRPIFPFMHRIDPQLTQAMLLHGANVNAVNFEGRTALSYAVTAQKKIIMEQLLRHGADQGGKTLIELAEANHQPALVALLRKYSKHP